MPELDFSEFDASVARFEAVVGDTPRDELSSLGRSGLTKSMSAKPPGTGGKSAHRSSQDIYAGFKVTRAARGLLGSTSEAHAYSQLIDALKDEYTRALAAELAATAGSYAITARLKGYATTLKEAVSRVKANTEAMNTVSEFIAGATALVDALV
jgi:hypothetical protein